MAFKSLLAAIVVTTAALGTHAAKAETALNIPFSFTVAGQALPAGVYTIKQDNNVVIFRTKDAAKSFAYALRPGDPSPDAVKVGLKFEASGDTHILRQIQIGSKLTPRLQGEPAPTAFDPARLSQGR